MDIVTYKDFPAICTNVSGTSYTFRTAFNGDELTDTIHKDDATLKSLAYTFRIGFRMPITSVDYDSATFKGVLFGIKADGSKFDVGDWYNNRRYQISTRTTREAFVSLDLNTAIIVELDYVNYEITIDIGNAPAKPKLDTLTTRIEANYIYDVALDSVTLTGNNIDKNIQANIGYHKIDESIYNVKPNFLEITSNSKVTDIAVTDNTNVTIPPRTIAGINDTVKARTGVLIFKKLGLGQVSEYLPITQQFTQDLPTITVLEPNGVNQNRDKDIIVSWASTNQGTFSLKAKLGTSILASYTGTTQNILIIPKGTLPSGNITLELTVTYINGYDNPSVTKSVTFLAYGNPNPPTQDSTTVYNTALPTYTWQSEEQVSYELQLLKSEEAIISTGEVLGTTKTYTTTTALENNTSYTVKVRVKNQFNLWSDWSVKTIQITFTELPKAQFEIIQSGNSVVLNITNTDHVLFKNSEVWRKETSKNNWIRVAYNLGRTTTYTDHTLKHNTSYDYKIRSNATDGALSESDVKSAIISIKGFEFVNVEDWWNSWKKYNQVGEKSIEVSVNSKRNVVASIYAGNTGATIETDGISYRELSFTMELSYGQYESLLEIINDSKVMLFRDERGHKCYGYVTSDIPEEHIEFNGYRTGFTFTEVNFLEQDMYRGDGGLVLVYLDGAYKLDGSLVLTGVRVV